MKKKKKHGKIFFTTHQNNLIQSVINLTIILVQEWKFFVESEQSYEFFFRFSTKCVVLNSSVGMNFE